MSKIILLCFFINTLNLNNLALSQSGYSYPPTKKIMHKDTYFGTEVDDPYSWMEDMQSAEVKEWVSEENAVTESYLSKIPFREKIRQKITDLWNYNRYTVPFRAGEFYFFFKNDGLQNQSVLYRQKGLEGKPEIFLDPNKFSNNGTVAMGETSLSWDNKYLAYSLNRKGSDWMEIYIADVVTGEQLKDTIQWVKFSGINWKGNGFYYNRYDEGSGDKLKEKNQSPKIYFHTIGSRQSEDQLIYEDKEHPERFISMFTTEDQIYQFLSVNQKGTRGNTLYYQDLRKADFTYKPINENFENSYYVIATNNDEIFLQTNNNAANYRLIKFIPSTNQFFDVIPESKEVMKSSNYFSNKLIVEYMQDAYSKVKIFDKEGKFEKEIAFPTLGTVSGFDGRKEDSNLFYSFVSFNYPTSIYKYNISDNTSSVFHKAEVKINPEDYESKQVFYPSKDGTMIPLFLVYKKGIQLNGSNPTLLYGYGGFNISMTPTFSAIRTLFLESGGIYAEACLRGGGEYGDDWHKAGMQLNKQNVFDDFISAAEYLIREKYTSSEKLAIQGGSNGGLLIGAVINQRPDLFKVALPAVGVMDMLKFHKFTIGWAWVTDYGSSDDSINFRNLFAYSPLHNIKSQNYPATLITTSDHDDRVVPLHSYKYTATLQEKNKSDNPILLRVETDAGHGAGKPTSKAIDEQTDIWSFIFYNLGIEPQ